MRKLILLVTTLALVAVGAASFAAFESHLIDVRAHNEKATYVTPDEVDYGTTLMQASYDKSVTIHLSASFLTQTTYADAEYSIYCDEKPQADYVHAGNITPFIVLTGPDGVPHNGCGAVALGGNLDKDGKPILWADGNALTKSINETATWGLKFYAPVCSDNYNALTDPVNAATRPVPLVIDKGYCTKGPGGDSDEYTDLGSIIKFQITGFSS